MKVLAEQILVVLSLTRSSLSIQRTRNVIFMMRRRGGMARSSSPFRVIGSYRCPIPLRFEEFSEFLSIWVLDMRNISKDNDRRTLRVPVISPELQREAYVVDGPSVYVSHIICVSEQDTIQIQEC